MEEIRRLAGDIGLTRLYLVGNKVRSAADEAFIQQIAEGLPILGFLPYDPQVIQADLTGQAVYDLAPETVAAGRGIWEKLMA
jgi:CO dehydrogenase maturation factor